MASWKSLICIMKMVVRRFFVDTRGAVALQFGLMLIPVLTLAGGAIDIGNVMRLRMILQNAADSASVGSITKGSPAYIAAESMAASGSIPVGVTDATNLFNQNIAALKSTNSATVTATPTVTKTNLLITSSVTWTATVPMSFLGLIGQSSWTITDTSAATTALPQYLDFYLMLDVSGSMGLPSTIGEQNRLAQLNPDFISQYPTGCVFACHFAGYSGFAISRNDNNWNNPQVTNCPTTGTSACIQLRTDAVGVAIQQLLQTALSTQTVPNEYRIGLYPFIDNLETYFAITANIAATGAGSLAQAAANISQLLDTGIDPVLGSGGTHFENAFPQMNALIPSVGTGNSASSPLPYLFVVTDGSQDNQYQWGGAWWGSNQATTLDPTLCSAIKSRGVTISILYIPYQTIQNPTNFSGGEDYAANANIPNIPGALTSCASTGFFFTANTPADITTALNAMFNKAVASARITN